MMSESHLTGSGSGEIMLFGVRVQVDPMRKSVSMNDLSQYVHVQHGTHDSLSNSNSNSNSNNPDGSAMVVADSGYASADDVARNTPSGVRERKRGVPWTEDEHKLFLLGLKKVGKGDWRGISRNYVKTRTPTQVASHAQKYFLRRSNLNRRRRRTSLFDITTDSVVANAIPMEEEQVNEDNNINNNNNNNNNNNQLVSPLSGFPMAALPPLSIKNQTETVTFNTEDHVNNGPTLPVSVFPTPDLSRADNYSDRTHKRDSLSLSLSLSISVV